jgi:Pvc16 N-terminal domain
VSNALGIAAVTAVLRDLLNNGLIDASVGDVTVSAQSPDKVSLDGDEQSQLNLFLYRVTPNQGWRNVGLPSADSSGQSRLSNPPLALDLHYLLTAYGASDFQPEILLGYGMQVLHETPVLDRQAIRDTLAPGPVTGGILPPVLQTLTAAEIADQVEQLKITPETLSSEEISNLWSAFGAHYRPTTGYMVSVVLIEGRRTTQPSLPVRLRQVFALPLRDPHVESVTADDGKPIVSTSTLVVEGERLQHDPMELLVGGLPATISDAANTRLVAALPGALRAGVQSVQVKHGLDFGTPNEPHRGFESNVAAFVLHPVFGGLGSFTPPLPGGMAPYTGTVEVTITPVPAREQRIVLLLNRTSPAVPSSYAFVADRRTSDGDPVVVKLEDLARGEYFVRVQVDGAESPLDLDPSSVDFGPKVTI